MATIHPDSTFRIVIDNADGTRTERFSSKWRSADHVRWKATYFAERDIEAGEIPPTRIVMYQDRPGRPPQNLFTWEPPRWLPT